MAGAVDFRLAPALVLRAAGGVTVLLGAVWVVAVLAGSGRGGFVVLGVVTAALLTLVAMAVWRPPVMLRLTDRGYAVRWVRGAGVRQAPWDEVETVEVAPLSSGRALVVSLTEERRTWLPLSLLGRSQHAAREAVYARLNAAHGYRRLRP